MRVFIVVGFYPFRMHPLICASLVLWLFFGCFHRLVHKHTQIDLSVFIGCGYDDYPTNILYAMTQLAQLHCIYWIWILGMERMMMTSKFIPLGFLTLRDALFFSARKFTLWKLMKYVNRNLRCHFCKRYILPGCNTGKNSVSWHIFNASQIMKMHINSYPCRACDYE